MNADQIDMFGEGKSTEEIQLAKAIEVVECAGYRVVKCREDIRDLSIEHGYMVSEPPVLQHHVVTLADLRDHFFMRMWKKYPDKQMYYLENRYSEMRVIRLLVESIEEKGFSRTNAIKYGASIVDTIFNNADEFRFKKPIDLRVLGQKKSGWITAKAIEILNQKVEKYTEEQLRKRIKDMEKKLEDTVSNNLDELLEKVEANNGQEEGN